MTQEEILKQEILDKTKEYYELVHKKDKTKIFEATKSKINYAGRVFDEKELVNLVDSSLDFWLTYGNYSKKFEKNLAEYLKIKWAFLIQSNPDKTGMQSLRVCSSAKTNNLSCGHWVIALLRFSSKLWQIITSCLLIFSIICLQI